MAIKLKKRPASLGKGSASKFQKSKGKGKGKATKAGPDPLHPLILALLHHLLALLPHILALPHLKVMSRQQSLSARLGSVYIAGLTKLHSNLPRLLAKAAWSVGDWLKKLAKMQQINGMQRIRARVEYIAFSSIKSV